MKSTSHKLSIISLLIFCLFIATNFSFAQDTDGDGIIDGEDNCIQNPNGPTLGTCIQGDKNIRETCANNGDCGANGFCSMNQDDKDNDGVGDACDFFTYTHIQLSLRAHFNGDFDSFEFGVIFGCVPDRFKSLTITNPAGEVISEYDKSEIFIYRSDGLCDAYKTPTDFPLTPGEYSIKATDIEDKSESVVVSILASDIPTDPDIDTPVITTPTAENQWFKPCEDFTWEPPQSFSCDYIGVEFLQLMCPGLPGDISSFPIPELPSGKNNFLLRCSRWRDDVQRAGGRDVAFNLSQGSALLFDGGDKATIPNHLSLNPSQITIECWVRFDRLAWGNGNTGTDYQELIAKGGDRTDGVYQINQGGSDSSTHGIWFGIGPCCPSPGVVGGVLPLETNIWYHVAGTYDGETMKFYFNGNLTESKNVGSLTVGNAKPLYFGYNDTNGFPYYLDGTMDEIRIWNYARSNEEIQSNMCTSLCGYEDGLVGYWRLCEGDGQVVGDFSRNNNDGYLGSSTNAESSDPTWVLSDSPKKQCDTTSTSTIVSTTTTIESSTTSSIDISTTTTTICVCPLICIYGEKSEEVALLRNFRDNNLMQIPEGKELIKLYYQWSPTIVRAMEGDEEFKQEVKELIDEFLLVVKKEADD